MKWLVAKTHCEEMVEDQVPVFVVFNAKKFDAEIEAWEDSNQDVLWALKLGRIKSVDIPISIDTLRGVEYLGHDDQWVDELYETYGARFISKKKYRKISFVDTFLYTGIVSYNGKNFTIHLEDGWGTKAQVVL